MPSKTPLLLKYLCSAALVSALFLAGYWVKCQLDVNILPDYTWEERFPFLNSFQKNKLVSRSTPGMVFTSTFDELLPRYYWGGIWARDAGTVVDSIVPEGLQGSNALLIRSTSLRDWAIASSVQLEVSPGETYYYSGYARTTAKGPGYFTIILYDALDKVTTWNSASLPIKGAGWQLYTNRFVVPEGTARLRVRLAGSDVGDSFFDDIMFVRVK